MANQKTWECPICGGNAYQKYGGFTAPARRIKMNEGGQEEIVLTTVHMGTHFMCKGCSVFFSNPYLFNKLNIGRPS